MSTEDYKVHGVSKVPNERQHFSPYADNGGSIVAIAGSDFAAIASDTRLCTGFQIYTRDQSKLFKLSPSTVLGSTGCWCDILTFTKVMEAKMKMYEHLHRKTMSTPAVAQLTSVLLYYKRFFPYYISNILAGLDNNGRGCIYGFDPIGHYEREEFRAGGSSSALLQPLLDNQVGYLNMERVKKVPVTQEKAIALIKDTFVSAAERDIYTGDGIIINVITKDGIRTETFDLRKD